MDSFPAELLHKIVHSADFSEQDLRQLRAVSATFKELVSQDVFHKLTVTPTVKSGRNLRNILTTSTLALYVKEIVFVEDAINDHERDGEILKVDEVEEDEHDAAVQLRSSVAEAYSRLHLAPALHTLVFRFSEVFQEENIYVDEEFAPSNSLQLNWAILGAIAKNPFPLNPLRSLTLSELRPFCNVLYDSEYLAAIVGALHHLDILAGDRIHLRFLAPAHNRHSLAIGASMFLGVKPPLNLKSLMYPHLESLKLYNVLFDNNIPMVGPEGHEKFIGTEDFIARHGKTLRRLELLGIWKCYMRELEVLTDLSVGFHQLVESISANSQEESESERYCEFANEEDIPAFNAALEAAVASSLRDAHNNMFAIEWDIHL
ncbi:hypothetical protein FA95DRAFT_1604659 [Auriscalpium vulgare]|uniref:Uncharacterized protein n=1 Tax=Auriscalpium vulgare TaxID=40419 RepID=A0ACB8RZ09_9AGAM|nr:hypothetical protein FA95DRAFT_1604659 [Auriscalpium vulgare]